MSLHEKYRNATADQSIFTIDYHLFMELENKYNYLEIAEEFGISIGEVNILKKKITRT